MDESTYNDLMCKLEDRERHLDAMLKERRKLESKVTVLTADLESLHMQNEKLLLELGRAEGRAEAYAHCIDAMNGIQHEKKVGFRHADG